HATALCSMYTLSLHDALPIFMRKDLKMLLVSLVALLSLSTATSTVFVNAEDKEPLLVGMEAAYPPYNWTQSDDSNDAVAIQNSPDRKSTRLNSSHVSISYAVF